MDTRRKERKVHTVKRRARQRRWKEVQSKREARRQRGATKTQRRTLRGSDAQPQGKSAKGERGHKIAQCQCRGAEGDAPAAAAAGAALAALLQGQLSLLLAQAVVLSNVLGIPCSRAECGVGREVSCSCACLMRMLRHPALDSSTCHPAVVDSCARKLTNMDRRSMGPPRRPASNQGGR